MEKQSSNLKRSVDLTKEFLLINNVPNSDAIKFVNLLLGQLEGDASHQQRKAMERGKPATSIENSLHDDHLICLDCGRRMKCLKRHIHAHHQLTPAMYRAKWKLPVDYPMTAPSYSAKRAKLARKQGLGQDGKKNSKGHRQAARPPSNRTVNFKKKI